MVCRVMSGFSDAFYIVLLLDDNDTLDDVASSRLWRAAHLVRSDGALIILHSFISLHRWPICLFNVIDLLVVFVVSDAVVDGACFAR
ncbi:unnamed protein product [Eruca vesicaria subsp. sativa]|uniref:Uncharacterized protein n=1 Tax=Eruca vesicaria subsp. sativa TaxID=29727 RepID=A0ABC8IVX2_ERUVS|nr:unnamed protein product [Eruca vesicaria subsp. sativa]